MTMLTATLRPVLRSAALSVALAAAALAAPAAAAAAAGSASAAAAWTAGVVQAAPSHQANGLAHGAATEQVKFFKKKVFRRGHSSHYGAFGDRRRGVAGVGHGRSLTGRSVFDHPSRYGRHNAYGRGHGRGQHGNHGGAVVKKGVFPFGFVIVK